jgi:hypothetical protein
LREKLLRSSRWSRPVALLQNGHGDKLMALPTLRALCDVFPGRLRLVCSSGDRRRFYPELPLLDVHEIPFRYDEDERGRTWRFDAGEVARAAVDADLVISLNTWCNDDVWRLAASLPRAERLGFPPFSRHLNPPAPTHMFDRLFELARWVEPSLEVERYSYPPAFDAATVEAALRIRETLPPPRRIVAVHMNTAPAKMWPLERWAQLLEVFLDRHPEYVVLMIDRAPFGFEPPGGRPIVPVYGLPLATAFALVGSADFFIGVDSCLLHAADLYRVPGIGLFGSTDAGRWGFRFGPHRHVVGARGMDGITTAAVLAAIEQMLPQYPSGPVLQGLGQGL